MVDIGFKPTNVDWFITQQKDSIISFKCKDSVTGDPFDISGYSIYFKTRLKKDIESKEVINIDNSDINKTDSGEGTIDTFTIDISNNLTDLCQQIYYYDVVFVDDSTDINEIFFQGQLNVQWSVTKSITL